MSEEPSTKRSRVSPAEGAAANDWLALNVSGTKLLIKRSTLTTAAPDSMLAIMFDPSSPFGVETDESGAILLERDADAFVWILGVLRRGGAVTALPPPNLRDRIRAEADYFGLDDIVKTIDASTIEASGQDVEHKCVTECVDNKSDVYVPKPGWAIQSIQVTPARASASHDVIMRTIHLERLRSIHHSRDEQLLYIDGDEIEDCVLANFGAMKPVSALASVARPTNVVLGNEVIFQGNVSPDSVHGRVLFLNRPCKSTYFEVAEFAQDSGALALVIVLGAHDPQELRGGLHAPDGSEVGDITIPVLLAKRNSSKILGRMMNHVTGKSECVVDISSKRIR
uniref:Potassium channel tetramerisation-type BTB domain-containing protein n=1 Tax=Minutocellus polymorphus TaxID=265543 RepID=A0A7S0FUK7_9STRA